MAEPANRPAHPSERPGLVGRILLLVSQVIGLLFVSLLCSIIMEWIGIAFFWPEQGWHHAEEMLAAELEFLSENFRRSLLIDQPGPVILQWLTIIEEWVWQRSGFGDFAVGARHAAGEDSVWGGMNQAYVSIENYMLGAVFVCLTFVVRVGIVLLTTPLTVLAMITGLVDGLMRRDLRKFGAGRESSFIYHRVKRLILPSAFVPGLTYLSLPFSLNPMWIFMPCLIAFGIAVSVATSSFKKYL